MPLVKIVQQGSVVSVPVIVTHYLHTADTAYGGSYAFAALDALGYYSQNNAVPPSEFAATSFAGRWQAVINIAHKFVSVNAVRWGSVDDFGGRGFAADIQGDVNDDMLPLPNTVTISADRRRLDVRPKSYRVGPLSESDSENQGALSTEAINRFGDLTTVMSSPLISGLDFGGLSWQFASLASERVIDSETGKVSYRPYPSETDQEEHMTVGHTFGVAPLINNLSSRQR